MLTSTKVEEISDIGLLVSGKDGRKTNLGVYDAIILAAGVIPADALSHKIENQVRVFTIGDAQHPGNALVAIADAARVARLI